MDQDTLLIIGNGLSIDLSQHFSPKARRIWDTQNPLRWAVNAPGTRTPLIQLLPAAAAHIAEAQLRSPSGSVTDFNIINLALELADSGEMNSTVVVEIRHLLLHSFVAYQNHADKYNTLAGWRWGQFLGEYYPRFKGVISFNYDLNAERALEQHDVNLYHIGLEGESRGLPFLKPHGSIEYAWTTEADHVINMPAGFPLRVVSQRTNAPLRSLPRRDLNAPRKSADLVVPTEASFTGDFQWAAPGMRWLTSVGDQISNIILIGLSFSIADREELTTIFRKVSSSARAVVANPYPDSNLISALEERFSDVSVWRDGPDWF